MDYSKVTNQELYQIATDERLRLTLRYEAAKELQRRKGEENVRGN